MTDANQSDAVVVLELGGPIIWTGEGKPDWLDDAELCQCAWNPAEHQHRYMTWDYLPPRLKPAGERDWDGVTAFRIRADHPYYATPSAGGEKG